MNFRLILHYFFVIFTVFADISPAEASIKQICINLRNNLFGVNQEPEIIPPFENEPPIYRQTYVTKSDIQNAKQILTHNLSHETLASIAFDLYVSIRLRNYGLIFRNRILSILEKRYEFKDPYEALSATCVHFNLDKLQELLIGKLIHIEIGVTPQTRNTLSYYNYLVHELEHAIQLRDKNFSLPNSVTAEDMLYFEEFDAILAQHEFWKLIPDFALSAENNIMERLPNSHSKTTILSNLKYATADFSVYRQNHHYSSKAAVAELYRKSREEQ